MRFNFGTTRVSGLAEYPVAKDILSLRSLPTTARLKRIAAANITSINEIAELSTFELCHVLGIDHFPWVGDVIMEARAVTGGYEVEPPPFDYNATNNLITRYHVNGYSDLYVALRTGLDVDHVGRAIDAYNRLPRRFKNKYVFVPLGIKSCTTQELVTAHDRHNRVRLDMAGELHMHPDVVGRLIKQNGLPPKRKPR